MTTINGIAWLPLAASLAGFGSFCWALRGHFAIDGRIPAGMRLLSLFSLVAYLNYAGLLVWRGVAPTRWTEAGMAGFAASFLLFWWTVSTTRGHRLHIAYSDADPDMIYTAGPYAHVRHPFYLSYIVFWLATAAVAGEWQFVPVLILAGWYVRIARGEEFRFRISALSAGYAAYQKRTGMLLPRPGKAEIHEIVAELTQAAETVRGQAAAAVEWMAALRRLFLSYQGTENERPVRRDQATILFSVTLLFAFLGVGSCTLFTLAFEQHMNIGINVTYGIVVVLYGCLVAGGLRWRRQRDDAAFIRRSVIVLAALGVTWGILVNLFALVSRPDQQGILIGLIMALVSTPMLGVPLSVALAFYVPISVSCAIAILTQPIQVVAILSFLGFLMFTLIGMVNINKTILERSLGRLSLQKEHETIRVFLHEYEEISSDWLWETDCDGIFRNVGPRMATALQLGKAHLETLSIVDLFCAGERQEDDADRLFQFVRERSAFKDATLTVLTGERMRWLSLTGHPVYDERGIFRGFRGIGSDVTEAQVGRRKIEFLASHDALTGLLNRKAFVDGMIAACHGPESGRFALLLIDLDSFKGINDNLGHLAGDEVLRTVADRLRESVRPGDIGGRLGGDEFAVLLPNVDQAEAADIANRITKALSAYMLIDTLAIRPSGSIGIALCPDHGTDQEALMRRADLALYRAKERGKNTACLFELEFEREHLSRLRLQSELASALDDGQIFLHYQPIVDVCSGDIVSVEALVRWRHPTRGLLSADKFMPTAEQSDLMERLGEHVLRLACRAAAGWANRVPVAVNLSPRQLRGGRFVSVLKACLAESGLLPGRLSLEVTETIFLATSESIMSQLLAVRALGVRLILDDFGTGYSSLTYLRGFDVDGIKIDASFIRDLPGSQKVAAIVRTIGRLASDMNIYVVAEGIETDAQLAWLRHNGIPFAQGYLLGRPGEDGVFSDAESCRPQFATDC
nr:EAL domain-containing protein [uncultured Rhodopila sp.]